MQKIDYVYLFVDPRKPGKWIYENVVFDFEPFYVGRGRGRRMMHHLENNKLAKISRKNNMINSIIKETGKKPQPIKIFENLSFSESQRIEMDIISKLGRRDLLTGPLTNTTTGGEGVSLDRNETRAAKNNDKKYPAKNASLIKEVFQYNKNGNFIKKFHSQAAALAEHDKRIDFKKILNDNTQHGAGFLWTNSYQGEKIEPFRGKKCKEIVKLDKEFNIIERFANITLARDVYGYGIKQQLKTKNFYKECYWRYTSEL